MSGRARVHVGAFAALLGVTVAGCTVARQTPEIRYYMLTIAGDARPLGYAVRASSFTADPPYATERIAYRPSPYRMGYYTYHRWAALPQRLLAMALRDYLGPVAGVADGPALEISGHLRRLEELDEPDGWRGALALDLTARRDGQVILERSYVEIEPAAARSPEAVVAALSRGLQRILDRFVADLAASPDGRAGEPRAPR